MKVETIDYRGFEIKILLDETPVDPREWDNLGTMVCWHSRYNLGDEQINCSPIEWLYSMLNFTDEQIDYYDKKHGIKLFFEDGKQELFYDLIDRLEKDHIVMPLFLYDHGGIAMSTSPYSCKWDSGQVGFIYASYEKIKTELGWKKMTKKRIQKAKNYLEGEVETYDQYIKGDVYGYTIDDPKTGDHIDSCWGFYGHNWEESGLFDHAKPSIDCHIRNVKSKRFNKIKSLIVNRVPLGNRVGILESL